MAAKNKSRTSKGPQFLRYCAPIVEVLKEFGNSGSPGEVTDRVIELLEIGEAEQAQLTSNGQSRVRNQVAWARFYMVKAGLIDSSKRGIWGLTKAGLESDLTHEGVIEMFKKVQSMMPRKAKGGASSDNAGETESGSGAPSENEEESPDEAPHRLALLSLLKELPPAGFERLCQKLLRESGFETVVVTGKSHDGGIDGYGILEVNPFVTFNVLFQCKRYKDTVGSAAVRDFRGAMAGRADKGIILTTGSFTIEAKKEARRDGVSPIELVDGDSLVGMFEKLELGLTPKKVYELDPGFFDDYQEK